MLSSTIKDEGDINETVKRFMKKLKGCIAMTFRKIRHKENKHKDETTLYD